VPPQYLAHLSGNSPIARKIWRQEYSVRTETLGANRGHSGTHAELSGLVRSSANDRAVPAPRDDDRLAAQLRIVPLLDGRVEGVHVDVYDFPGRHTERLLFLSCGEAGTQPVKAYWGAPREMEHFLVQVQN
jgi:hypothetical protein